MIQRRRRKLATQSAHALSHCTLCRGGVLGNGVARQVTSLRLSETRRPKSRVVKDLRAALLNIVVSFSGIRRWLSFPYFGLGQRQAGMSFANSSRNFLNVIDMWAQNPAWIGHLRACPLKCLWIKGFRAPPPKCHKTRASMKDGSPRFDCFRGVCRRQTAFYLDALSVLSTSSSIFLASPKSIRLFSL